MLDSTHVVVAYTDTGGDSYGCAKVGVIDNNTVAWGGENVFNSAVTNHLSIAVLDSTHFVVAYRDDGGADYGAAIVGLTDGKTTISSYGSENVFNSAITYSTAVTALDSTHFAVAYKDAGNSSYGTAIVGVVSGTTISSYGSENVFNSAITEYIGITTLDSTHFVVTYEDEGGDDYGCARIGLTNGGTTISSYGTENIFNLAATYYTSVTALDSTHFAITYRDGGNSMYGTGIVGLTDGGTTISSYGSENVFNTATTGYISTTMLDSTHFVVTYMDDGGDDHGCARVGLTDGGTTISSYDTEQIFNSAVTRYISVASLSATDYVVIYKDDGGSDYGCARVWGTAVEQFTTESCFNTVNTEYNAVAMLDENHVVVAYKDAGDAGYGCAKVGVIAENTITWGTENVFNSGSTHYISIAALDSTHFVVSYQDLGNSNYGTAIVGLVSGITISSYGAENVFNSGSSPYTSVDALDSTHFVVAYRGGTPNFYGEAIIGLVSGTTISSYGSVNVFNSATTAYISVATLDSTHFVVIYKDDGGADYGCARIGLVSATTISSYGAENVFNSAVTNYSVVTALDSTHFVVVYEDNGNSYYGTGIVGLTDGGTTISSYGAENVFNSAQTLYLSIDKLDSTHFVVSYADIGNSWYGTTVVGTVSATTISSYGTENVFNSAGSDNLGITTLNSTDYVVVYKDQGDTSYGYGRVWQTLDESAFGTESCYNTANTEYNAVAMLDSTHIVVAYQNRGSSDYGCAKVGVITSNKVTWGTELCFNATNTNYISVAALDSTHFVVSYRDEGGSDYGCAKVGLVSGTTISSYGAENIFVSSAIYHNGVTALDSTHFVVAYRDFGDSSHGKAIVGVTSGTTISSYGASNTFNAASTLHISVSALDSTHFVVVYRDGGNSNHGTAIVGVVSSTTISSYGAGNVFNAADSTYNTVTALDSTHFAVGYIDVGNSSHGTGIVGVVSSTTISSYGAENVFNAAVTNYVSVSALDSTHFVVCYEDDGGSDYGCSRKGTVSSTTISSYDTEQTFNSAITIYIAVTTINSTDYVVVYKDDGGSDYGCGRVWGTVSGWSGIIIGVSGPAKVMGVAVADITSVSGIS